MKETGQGYIRRKQIMTFLQKYIENHGYSPSFKEIGEGVGIYSTSTVKSHLDILRAYGNITFTPGVARTIRILRKM